MDSILRAFEGVGVDHVVSRVHIKLATSFQGLFKDNNEFFKGQPQGM